MGFETFKRQRAPVTAEPAVTVQKRGTLSMNAAAYAALESPEAVELLYDREERLMGLRKIDPSAEHAYMVRPLGRGGNSWLISGRAFTVYYGIPTDTARRWLGRVEDGLLVVDLKAASVQVTGNRTAQRVTNLLPETDHTAEGEGRETRS